MVSFFVTDGHVVLKVKLSAHISHSITSSEQIQWKVSTIIHYRVEGFLHVL